MPGYQPISVVATALRTDERMLLDFRDKGWIHAVTRNETVFLASDQRYLARYILCLYQTKHLTDDQIQLVLSIQRPPYSIAQVDQILERHAPVSNPKHAPA